LREKAIELIQQLPPEASVEDMMETLYFLSKVERGLRRIDAGQVVSHEEAKRRFGR
jgi:predicted transcriptional regulator